MDWLKPATSKWLAGAATLALAAGLFSLRSTRAPRLVPERPAPDLRDAVAAPALAAAQTGWLQGAGALRAARALPPAGPRAAYAPLRRASSRAAFKGRRVIVYPIRTHPR
ncbi:MAG: hypothetical protein PHF00_06955 [Elusimicrobia bacterium]|nr:hypothetical protein [Elusimicrobiota bacterium]